jgi:hypothetical protein
MGAGAIGGGAVHDNRVLQISDDFDAGDGAGCSKAPVDHYAGAPIRYTETKLPILGTFMRYWFRCGCALLAASLAGAVAAASGLSVERSGLGLKPPGASLSSSEGLAQRRELTGIWQPREGGEVVYTGARDATRLGLRAAESYGGVYYPLSDTWGASLELGVIPGSALAPQRYSVAGLLHTALSADSSLSIGLKYRLYEPDFGWRAGMPGDLMAGNGYSRAQAFYVHRPALADTELGPLVRRAFKRRKLVARARPASGSALPLLSGEGATAAFPPYP